MTDRFDKFTERARKTLQLAQEEAVRLNHNYIGTEHILLGLLREGDGIAARVLKNLGVELSNARSMVQSSVGHGDNAVAGEIGLTPHAKRVIELAVDESRSLNHHYVGTEHILLALAREREETGQGFLDKLEVSPEQVRAQVIEVLNSSSGYRSSGKPVASGHSGRFDKFTERALKTLQFAQEEAQRFNHNYIGTEHILLGLVRLSDGVAAQVLTSFDPLILDKTRQAVEFIIGRGDRMIIGEIGLTPRAKRVIELAVDEARRLNHHYIGSEHLLLGLIREGEGIAAGVLESLGISLAKVRVRTLEVLKHTSETPAPGGGTFERPMRIDAPTLPASLPLDLLRTLFDYSIWARDQLLPLIQGLEEGQLREVPSELQKGVYGSLHDTLAHMAQSEWLWIQRCLGDSPLRLPKGEDFKDLAAIVDWWNTVHAEAVQYLTVITEIDLDTEITYLAPDGRRRTRKVWHMLLQVPNHQTEHRAQVATILGSLGLEVPPTDLVVYLSQA